MINRRRGLVCALLIIFALPGFAGPFGFERGMTKAQVISLVGKSAVKEDSDGVLELTSAPKPHPDIDDYFLMISPAKGLVKILAVGKTIESNQAGDQVRSKFKDLKQALVARYGAPAPDWDFVHTGSLFKEDRYFMMSLKEKERTLAAAWEFSSSSDGLQNALVEANALNIEKGYISVAYEFVGFSEYKREQKQKQDSVF